MAALTPGKPTTPWIAVATFYQSGSTPVSNKKDGSNSVRTQSKSAGATRHAATTACRTIRVALQKREANSKQAVGCFGCAPGSATARQKQHRAFS